MLVLHASYLPPKFKHDCQSCIYLGQFGRPDRKDAYLCPRSDGGSLILRHGDSGEEYSSSPVKVALGSCSSELHQLAVDLVRKSVITVGIDVEKIEKD